MNLGIKVIDPDNVTMISFMSLENYPIQEEMFKDNLRKALSKLPRSKITQNISKLIDENVIRIGFGENRKTYDLNYGVIAATENKLHSITIDLFEIHDDETKKEIMLLNKKRVITLREILRNNQTIKTNSIDIVQNLEDSYKETITNIIETIDYIQFVNALFFQYVKFLAVLTGFNQKAIMKVTNYLLSYYHGVVTKMFSNIAIYKNSLTKENLEWLNIIIDFGFYSEFSDYSVNTIMLQLGKIQPKDKLQKIKKNLENNRGFESIPFLLNKFGIISIQDITYQELIKRTGGRAFFRALNTNMATTIAVLITKKYDIAELDIKIIDLSLVNKTEALVFNAKRNLVISK